MASEGGNCFICENTLQGSEVIEGKKRGLETLRKSSITRNDNKIQLLEGLQSIVVHDGCRKKYIHEKYIAAAVRRGSNVTTPRVQLRSTTPPTFPFKDHCFLCATEITADFIAKQKQTRLCDRNIV